MGERGLDDALDVREALGERPAAEGDECRVDVRARTEHGAGDRVETGALARELDENGNRAVRLRARIGEEAVGDLTLHHHTPALEPRKRIETLDDDRGG